MTRLILLFALVASAIGLFWHEMGRPSQIFLSIVTDGSRLQAARIGGNTVRVTDGEIDI